MDTNITLWKLSSLGMFNLKSVCFYLADISIDRSHGSWKTVCRWPGPQRVKIFLRLAKYNKLLINVERLRRHISNTTTYEACRRDAETTLHVLHDCGFASDQA